jgi:hypothetical protein
MLIALQMSASDPKRALRNYDPQKNRRYRLCGPARWHRLRVLNRATASGSRSRRSRILPPATTDTRHCGRDSAIVIFFAWLVTDISENAHRVAAPVLKARRVIVSQLVA